MLMACLTLSIHPNPRKQDLHEIEDFILFFIVGGPVDRSADLPVECSAVELAVVEDAG